MRFRRLMAASMAGVMAVSTAIVCQISASAEDIDIKVVDNSKIPVSELTDVSKVKIYMNFSNVPTGVYGTVTAYVNGSSWQQKTYATPEQYQSGDGQSWQANVNVNSTGEQIAELDYSAANWGYQVGLKTDNADFTAELTKIEFCKSDGTVVKTYDPNEATISVDNFKVSKCDNTNMAIGDSFTIAYDSTNTPNGAKYTIKATYTDADGNTSWPVLVKDDGSLDNSSADILGIEVSKATSGNVTTYTFTAVSATAVAYTLGVEISAAGDWSDTQYPWFGANIDVSVASSDVAVTSITLDKETATVQKGGTVTLKATVAPENATDKTVTWTSSNANATVKDGVVTGVAEGTAAITATDASGKVTATCVVTITKTDAEFIAAAKTAAETALGSFVAQNSTKASDIGSAVSAAVLKVNSDIETTVNDADFKITPATEEAAGSITGKITLTKGTETAEVTVSLAIAKLPVDDASRVAAAKTATETVLSGIEATNDIKEADILAKINTAIADTKAEAAITNFKVTPATTAAAGTVTGTVTLTSGTESATVAIDLAIEKLPEEKPDDPVEPDKPVTTDALWEGSVALGNWANSVQISGKDFTNFGAGTVVIELAPDSGAQVALKYGAGGWPVVPGCEEWYDVSGTKFEIKVTAEAMKTVGTNDLIVGGKNATIKKVTFVPAESEEPAPDKTVEIDTSTNPVTKIQNVDTKTDSSGNVTEQIAYCAISAADAKNYDSYLVTITRSSDGKKFKQVIEDCFKAVQYENKDGETVQVNAKGDSYCVLLDITGISSSFGTLTITIAPNA